MGRDNFVGFFLNNFFFDIFHFIFYFCYFYLFIYLFLIGSDGPPYISIFPIMLIFYVSHIHF